MFRFLPLGGKKQGEMCWQVANGKECVYAATDTAQRSPPWTCGRSFPKIGVDLSPCLMPISTLFHRPSQGSEQTRGTQAAPHTPADAASHFLWQECRLLILETGKQKPPISFLGTGEKCRYFGTYVPTSSPRTRSRARRLESDPMRAAVQRAFPREI